MRILLLEDDDDEARAICRALGEHHDIRTIATLGDAMRLLGSHGWQPEIVIADLSLPDSQGSATIEALQAVAGGTPVIVSSGVLSEALRRQVDALGAIRIHEKHDGYAVLRAVLRQQEKLQQQVLVGRGDLLAEIDKVAQRAAEAAVAKALARMLERLGLHDDEGVRTAVRLARAWETAKARFFGALAAGFASAVVLALAAGFAAMLESRMRR